MKRVTATLWTRVVFGALLCLTSPLLATKSTPTPAPKRSPTNERKAALETARKSAVAAMVHQKTTRVHFVTLIDSKPGRYLVMVYLASAADGGQMMELSALVFVDAAHLGEVNLDDVEVLDGRMTSSEIEEFKKAHNW